MLTVRLTTTMGEFRLELDLQAEDEVVVLLGPSGAGKSLTLQSVAGLVTPDEGLIELDGRRLFDSGRSVNLPPQQRQVGYVFQNYALFPNLTVQQNVGYGLHRLSRAERATRVAEVIQLVRLTGLEQRRPHQLSGGQQQRVALARALATEPRILLLDEPFAALDAPIRANLRQEFRSLQQRLGIPALFVTHDLEEAATLASRIAVIVDGQVHQYDRTRTILDRPADRQVAELVQSRNIISGTIKREPEGVTVVLPCGTIPGVDPSWPDGTTVEAVIRPEVIRIVRPDGDLERLQGDTLFSGMIVDLIDYGTRIVVLVDVQGTALEVSLSPTASRRLGLQVGGSIRLAIRPEDVHLIPGSP
jgi:molybdate transport system ATP-binding protein